MKLDMHCHVKEGSIDSKVSLDEYITLLKERGFDGMLITDHDTYKGCLLYTSQQLCGQHFSYLSGQQSVVLPHAGSTVKEKH